MSNNLSFITTEGDANLVNRFAALIKGTRNFDCLVGYFYAGGFHWLYKSLENTEKIRILKKFRVGNINKKSIQAYKLNPEASK